LLYKIEVWSFKVTTILERVCDVHYDGDGAMGDYVNVDGDGVTSMAMAQRGWHEGNYVHQ